VGFGARSCGGQGRIEKALCASIGFALARAEPPALAPSSCEPITARASSDPPNSVRVRLGSTRYSHTPCLARWREVARARSEVGSTAALALAERR
jgi:hypothetical protein